VIPVESKLRGFLNSLNAEMKRNTGGSVSLFYYYYYSADGTYSA
jgi:hypothetical protein